MKNAQLFFYIMMLSLGGASLMLQGMLSPVRTKKESLDRIQKISNEVKNKFLTMTTVNEIQKLAYALRQEDQIIYPIIDQNRLEADLKILGLTGYSTPLSIRYRYDRLQEKLLNNDEKKAAIENAYHDLMNMLGVMPLYAMGISDLANMDNAVIRDMYSKIHKKDTVVNKKSNVIHCAPQPHKIKVELSNREELKRYEKELDDFFKQRNSLRTFFGLSPHASRDTVQSAYDQYREKNNLDALKAQVAIGTISKKDYEIKLLKIMKLKEKYDKYAQAKRLEL